LFEYSSGEEVNPSLGRKWLKWIESWLNKNNFEATRVFDYTHQNFLKCFHLVQVPLKFPKSNCQINSKSCLISKSLTLKENGRRSFSLNPKRKLKNLFFMLRESKQFVKRILLAPVLSGFDDSKSLLNSTCLILTIFIDLWFHFENTLYVEIKFMFDLKWKILYEFWQKIPVEFQKRNPHFFCGWI